MIMITANGKISPIECKCDGLTSHQVPYNNNLHKMVIQEHLKGETCVFGLLLMILKHHQYVCSMYVALSAFKGHTKWHIAHCSTELWAGGRREEWEKLCDRDGVRRNMGSPQKRVRCAYFSRKYRRLGTYLYSRYLKTYLVICGRYFSLFSSAFKVTTTTLTLNIIMCN